MLELHVDKLFCLNCKRIGSWFCQVICLYSIYVPVLCRPIAQLPFIPLTWFLHHVEDLELNFPLVLTIEYSVENAFCEGSNNAVIPIEHSVKCSGCSAGMDPSRDSTFH